MANGLLPMKSGCWILGEAEMSLKCSLGSEPLQDAFDCDRLLALANSDDQRGRHSAERRPLSGIGT